MPNPIVRWQLVSPDPAAAARFFQQLFGWNVSQVDAIGYREVTTGEGGLPGGIWPGPAEARPFVQLFVAVPDVEASVRRAAELGATTIVPRTALPEGDVMAVVQDPTGLTIGVCTLREEGRAGAG
jgi:uncharacterized protein